MNKYTVTINVDKASDLDGQAHHLQRFMYELGDYDGNQMGFEMYININPQLENGMTTHAIGFVEESDELEDDVE